MSKGTVKHCAYNYPKNIERKEEFLSRVLRSYIFLITSCLRTSDICLITLCISRLTTVINKKKVAQQSNFFFVEADSASLLIKGGLLLRLKLSLWQQ